MLELLEVELPDVESDESDPIVRFLVRFLARLVRLLVDGRTLGMSGEGPLDADRLEHGSRNTPSEGTLHLGRNHLGANFELVTDEHEEWVRKSIAEFTP